jgi:hypothetical protein
MCAPFAKGRPLPALAEGLKNPDSPAMKRAAEVDWSRRWVRPSIPDYDPQDVI